ncbi:MAG: hypothetical protein PUJ51_14455 [Clostridiales bacterium]|uniref:hypothetical protein n=1 Tax=Terrisporobacter sp. TaxID=1965305 RepID=UPI002A54A221|nr:hypothetical protein [Terrisporobacter sp.]MDD7755687.1 hypothetical protein [Clostridiales bacterium]MDY4135196.1 hypothetical protein [Terrisporobacter sp.]
MKREEEILQAARDYVSGVTLSSPSDVIHFENGAKWADKHPASAWHDPSKEIKELIIHCVDKCAEHEMYPKDILNKIYEYIDKWYKDEN